jgi:molybdopterin molybdotransferase
MGDARGRDHNPSHFSPHDSPKIRDPRPSPRILGGMLNPTEALAAILERIPAPGTIESIPLRDAAGRSLARPAISDVEMPPFEKAMMDGFAVRSSDFPDDGKEISLLCVGESRAGVPFDGEVPAGSCAAIYTGAALPPDCDAVEMVERTRREGDRVHFEKVVPPDQHVSHRGEIVKIGETVFEPRRRLSAADVSVLAAIGCDPVPCFRRPRVSILTTGDELVPATERPGPGQIREGNTLFLAAACRRMGCDVLRAGIVPDEREALEAAMREAIEQGDALVTTGGVSMGRYDLVGESLERIGVERVLHKISVKPGKPVWFGMRGEKPVFGLPGNPVSTLFSLEVFVRPALARLAGAGVEEEGERIRRGRWLGASRRAQGRQHNVPAKRRWGEDGTVELEPIPWRGSADIVSVSEADAFVVIEAESAIEAGEIVCYRPLD